MSDFIGVDVADQYEAIRCDYVAAVDAAQALQRARDAVEAAVEATAAAGVGTPPAIVLATLRLHYSEARDAACAAHRRLVAITAQINALVTRLGGSRIMAEPQLPDDLQ
jgi:hypothetical protein